MGLRNVILQYNTLSMMSILVTGLKWRPQGGTQNKQRACVRLYWLLAPLTACRHPKYPVSASVQSTNSTKVFDTLKDPKQNLKGPSIEIHYQFSSFGGSIGPSGKISQGPHWIFRGLGPLPPGPWEPWSVMVSRWLQAWDRMKTFLGHVGHQWLKLTHVPPDYVTETFHLGFKELIPWQPLCCQSKLLD